MFEYGDEPIMDDPLLENYNLVAKAEQFMNIANYQVISLPALDFRPSPTPPPPELIVCRLLLCATTISCSPGDVISCTRTPT